MTLDTAVSRDFATGITDIRAGGTLDVAGAAVIRRAVLKCVADSPVAIMVDLGAVREASDAGLTVLPTLHRRLAGDDPPTPLLAIAPAGSVAATLGAGFMVYADRSAASDALTAFRPDRHRAHLPLAPARGAPSAARTFVASICAEWRLAHLTDEAQLVANELVTNAVVHAGTDLALTLSQGHDHLTVTVRDRNTRVPRLRPPSTRYATRGRGLAIVEVIAVRWGTVRHPDGKSVWAHLPMDVRLPP